MKTNNFLLIIILINIIAISNYQLIFWAVENGLMISDFIELTTINGKRRFVSTQDIKPKQKLLTIPFNLTFDIEETINLLDNNLNSQYKKFKNLKINTLEQRNINLQKEKIFLSYIIFLIQHKLEYEKTEFYQKYKFLIENIKKYSIKSPLLYTSDQIEYLSGTFLGKTLNEIKILFQDEIKIFKNDSFYKKDLLFNEYVHSRLLVENNFFEVLRHIKFVPLFNYLERIVRDNTQLTIEKNGDINIFSKGKINKGEIISIFSPRRTNVEKFIWNGEVNQPYANYGEKYILPAFSPGLYYKYNIYDIELYKKYNIDLLSREFEIQAVQIYKNNSIFFTSDDKDAWSYGVLLENIEFYKNYVENFNFEIFKDFEDRNNIRIVMKGEAKLLGKAYNHVKLKYERLKIIENEQKDNKNTDL